MGVKIIYGYGKVNDKEDLGGGETKNPDAVHRIGRTFI